MSRRKVTNKEAIIKDRMSLSGDINKINTLKCFVEELEMKENRSFSYLDGIYLLLKELEQLRGNDGE